MKRKTLDIILSIGGLGLAGLLVIVAVVLTTEANFSNNYVKDQLSEQKITFTTVDKLAADDKAFTEARTGCVVKYAGQLLTTGKQAECYANEYIGGHLKKQPAGTSGLTYAEIGTAQTDLRAKIAAGKASGDPGVAALEKQLADYTAARDTVFRGEMLRGALLSSYGFSVLGEKAALAAQVAYVGAGVLALLAVAGFVHAFVTPRSRAFAPVEAGKRPETGLIAGKPAQG